MKHERIAKEVYRKMGFTLNSKFRFITEDSTLAVNVWDNDVKRDTCVMNDFFGSRLNMSLGEYLISIVRNRCPELQDEADKKLTARYLAIQFITEWLASDDTTVDFIGTTHANQFVTNRIMKSILNH